MIHVGAQSIWLAIGLLGQALFGARFVVQWLHSETLGKSRFPRGFWQISVVAGVLILSYAIHRRDPVFISGEAMTLAIFCRNLQLLSRKAPVKASREHHSAHGEMP